ncbi:UvrD-helicase domain-containing protein [Candidatus Marithrix sp. Canyon 246]|uniref:UvrD-helicase domain-containing protein n=1 Tax=Candidatus Marithrix sp. Canyon 246 TaxID=1827136 RepID=UPI000849F7FF|nr:UvrD-helicase domain-containing protein [Candidatus Marithrix sp. Canyon 246]
MKNTTIEASAGTGKTYTITTLVLRLILEKRLTINKILVVTFTKAATEELHNRIRSSLREAFQKALIYQILLFDLLVVKLQSSLIHNMY